MRVGLGADAQDVDQRAAGIAHRLDDALRAAPAVVFDDDAGAGAQIRFDKGVRAPGVARDNVDTRLVQAAGERSIFDDEFDFEAWQQDLVEHPDHQLVLTNG